jgi:hypothetical protein
MLQILEVAIGLAFVFTLVSLACSTVNEWIAGLLGRRGRVLWQGVANLVGSELQGRMEASQLFQGLRLESWLDRIFARLFPKYDRSQPSYVNTPGFVLTLLAAVSPGGIPQDTATLKAAIQGMPAEVPEKVRKALLALVEEAGQDLEKAKENLGRWFDAAMDALAGRYKRWSQQVLFVLGLAAAVVLGIDAVEIGTKLWTNDSLRAAMNQAATDFVQQQTAARAAAPPAGTATAGAASTGQKPGSAAETVKELRSLQSSLLQFDYALSPADRRQAGQSYLRWLWLHWAGFVLTGVAASLGGPFWFDLLNRLVDLRLAGKKPEPSTRSDAPPTVAVVGGPPPGAGG